jgi:hypothetical protein
VTHDEGQLGVLQIAIQDMQIGAANSAGMNLQQNLIGTGSRAGNFQQLQGRPRYF